MTYREEYTYDGAGNLLSYKTYDKSGNVTYRTDYTYDSAGNQLSYQAYDRYGNTTSWEKTAYDILGNPISYENSYGGKYISIDTEDETKYWGSVWISNGIWKNEYAYTGQ